MNQEANKKDIAEADKEPAAEQPSVKKKKIIIIVAAAVLLLLLVVAGLFFFGIIGSKNHAPVADAKSKSDGSEGESVDGNDNANSEVQPVYFNLDEFIVNLNKVGGAPSFLKMAITLELESDDSVEKIGQKMPLIRDTFQVYLRELRSDDLQGSAGVFRLRQELLLRLNKLMYPVKISDILFREILIQ
jgi:flagellar FliL protein